MLRVCPFGTALVLLLLAPFAQAADKESNERAARKACLSGDYAKGVEILSDLFLDTKNPTHIYNQARCYEQNNRYAEAASRFREYLRKSPDIKASERAEVEDHIEECEALLGKAQAPTTPTPAPAPAAAPAPVVAPEPPAPVILAPPAEPTLTEAPSSKGYGLLIAGVCTGLAGLASVGVGIYYYDQARQLSTKEATQDNKNAGKHAENMQWLFYSLGGVAVATGTVMAIFGWPTSETTASTSVAPVVGPGLAGIAAQGMF